MDVSLVRRSVGLGACLILGACAHRSPANLPIVPGVRVDAAVDQYAVGPDRGFVRAKVTLTNRGAAPVRFAVGGCAVVLHAYPADGRDRAAVWSSARSQRTCPDVRRVFELAPGDSAALEESFVIDPAATAGLGPGRYEFAVSIGFLEPAANSPEYRAGSLTISR